MSYLLPQIVKVVSGFTFPFVAMAIVIKPVHGCNITGPQQALTYGGGW